MNPAPDARPTPLEGNMADDPTTPPADPATPPDDGTPKTYGEDYVKQLRNESGNYRTQLRTAEAALTAAQEKATAAEASVPTLTARAESAERRALVLEVALEKGLAATLVSRVNGTTREEIEADADALVALFRTDPEPDPLKNYGAGGNEPPKSTPPSASAALHALFKNRG